MLLACDGREGVEKFLHHHNEIALVITDYGLPVFDGEEVYRQIRQIDARVPVALVTGYVEPERRMALAARGIVIAMTKPYKPKDLLAVIRTLIDSAAL